MNVLPMLLRLEGALGRDDLIDQMILVPQRAAGAPSKTQEVNLVVGYNSSPRSQVALDLTLWIAHQTRLATRKQVTVQVVYVVDMQEQTNRISAQQVSENFYSYRNSQENAFLDTVTQHQGEVTVPHSYLADFRTLFDIRDTQKPAGIPDSEFLVQPSNLTGSSQAIAGFSSSTVANPLTQPPMPTWDSYSYPASEFEQADRILWQARCLADEWRGSLKTHLRFGRIAEELTKVTRAESATLLVLGCVSSKNPVVQALGQIPCPVIGIPSALYLS